MQNACIKYELDDCPIDETMFSRLVAAPLEAAGELARELPEDQRSQFAVYCYRRAHLRALGLTVATTCTKRALVEESGLAGELIHLQAQNLEATLSGDRYMAPRYEKKPVSLHKC